MLSLHRQFRFAARAVLRTPGQSVLAVVALGLGIRVALGAAPARIVRLIVRQGAWQLGVGAVVGIAGGYGLSSVFARVEPGLPVFDLQPHAVALGSLAAATLVAYLVPAMRAARREPANALSGVR